MYAVIDVNIVFSALLGEGHSSEVFEANRIPKVFEFVAPEFMFFELGKRMDKLLLNSRLSKEELSRAFAFMKGSITLVESSRFTDKQPEALALNEKDAPYLALALKLGCPIISGDKGLKEQSRVKVLSPAEALDIIYGLRQGV